MYFSAAKEVACLESYFEYSYFNIQFKIRALLLNIHGNIKILFKT
jgi:hypothetical protein